MCGLRGRRKGVSGSRAGRAGREGRGKQGRRAYQNVISKVNSRIAVLLLFIWDLTHYEMAFSYYMYLRSNGSLPFLIDPDSTNRSILAAVAWSALARVIATKIMLPFDAITAIFLETGAANQLFSIILQIYKGAVQYLPPPKGAHVETCRGIPVVPAVPIPESELDAGASQTGRWRRRSKMV